MVLPTTVGPTGRRWVTHRLTNQHFLVRIPLPERARGKGAWPEKANKAEHQRPRGSPARLSMGKAILLELQSTGARMNPSGKMLTPEIWPSSAERETSARRTSRPDGNPRRVTTDEPEALTADRTILRHHGIAYGWQHLWRQSPHSSPTPEVTLRTWPRGTGSRASNDGRHPYG